MTTSTSTEKRVTTFEATKLPAKQTNGGWVLSLVIHPNDVPEDVLKDPVGTRYMVVVSPFADESPDFEIGTKAFRRLGAVCRDRGYQSWIDFQISTHADTSLGQRMYSADPYDAAREKTCAVLGLTSSKEVRDNLNAANAFNSLADQYDASANDR